MSRSAYRIGYLIVCAFYRKCNAWVFVFVKPLLSARRVNCSCCPCAKVRVELAIGCAHKPFSTAAIWTSASSHFPRVRASWEWHHETSTTWPDSRPSGQRASHLPGLRPNRYVFVEARCAAFSPCKRVLKSAASHSACGRGAQLRPFSRSRSDSFARGLIDQSCTLPDDVRLNWSGRKRTAACADSCQILFRTHCRFLHWFCIEEILFADRGPPQTLRLCTALVHL